MEIVIKVTRERYEEVVSIEDDMHLSELTNRDAYNYITQFVSDGNGTYLSQEEARKLFKNVPRKDFEKYVTQFFNSLRDAFVNPQNKRDLEGQS